MESARRIETDAACRPPAAGTAGSSHVNGEPLDRTRRLTSMATTLSRNQPDPALCSGNPPSGSLTGTGSGNETDETWAGTR